MRVRCKSQSRNHCNDEERKGGRESVAMGSSRDTAMTRTHADFEAMIRGCFQSPDDIDALTRFEGAFRPYLTAVLRKYYPDPSLTADVYQMAFIKFIELFRGGQRPRTHYRAYLIAIAKHCLIDEIRRMRRSVSLSQVCEEEITQAAANTIELTEFRLLVHEAMKRLDRRGQFVLESYYLRGMPAAELARYLRIQPNSAHMAIKRCRAQLA